MVKQLDKFIKLLDYKGGVLGLDCSSSTIGWGYIIPGDIIKLAAYGYIKPLSSKYNLFERLSDVFDKISTLCDEFNPLCVSVEDIFVFMKGASTGQTMTTLAAFNRLSGLAAFKKTNNVKLYSVHDIREIIKTYFNEKNTIKKENIPDIIRKYLESEFKDIINKRGGVEEETYDAADGIAVALCHAICLLKPELFEALVEKKNQKKIEKKNKKKMVKNGSV
jgi:Holliday junction resolvasome RuvABC endonuclease subunit